MKYPDVSEKAWYEKYIDYVTDLGLMEGYEDGTFHPDNPATRAELATVVARLCEELNIKP